LTGKYTQAGDWDLKVLGIDTCEARGSVAVRSGGTLAALQRHETTEDYSSWLLPAVDDCLRKADLTLKSLDLLAVATGPGSFTGLRVGLTAVKAWAELFEKSTVGVSRLEVMARSAGLEPGYVAASFDAQRGQIFGGLYQFDQQKRWSLIEQEMVIAPDEFVKWVGERTGEETVHWSTLDPELLVRVPSWNERAARGERLIQCEVGLAAGVAELAEERARKGEFTDALQLDANYVRRSDAEIFWKDPGSHAL
jgi:tRNA threonylcarbamoyladenosine biosynthesis protein TsaB